MKAATYICIVIKIVNVIDTMQLMEPAKHNLGLANFTIGPK